MDKNTNMMRQGRCLNIGNCNKANSKELIDINIGEDFICPECQGELIEKVTKSIVNSSFIKKIIAIIAVVGTIAVGVFFLLKDTKTADVQKEAPVVVVDSASIKEPETEPETKEVTEKSGSVKPSTGVQESSEIVEKDLGFAVWIGKLKNGKPHDVQGTLKFKKSHAIDSRDAKGRMAGVGDKVIGTFEDGHLTQGKWYKADGNVESIILGGL